MQDQEFNPEKASQAQTLRNEREAAKERARTERQGKRLASFAIRKANEGHVDAVIKLKPHKFQPFTSYYRPPVFDEANRILAEDDLAVKSEKIYTGIDTEVDGVRIIPVNSGQEQAAAEQHKSHAS